MGDLLIIIALTLATGLAMPLGAILANLEKFKSKAHEAEISHGIVAAHYFLVSRSYWFPMVFQFLIRF